MNSAIFLVSDIKNDCKFIYSNGTQFKPGDVIKKETIKPDKYYDDQYNNHRPYFRKKDDDRINGFSICGDITITECIFEGCYAQQYSGGSIHIEQDCKVMIHSTIFSNSYTGKRFGGAGVICKTITDEDKTDFKTVKLQRLDVRYCCFQDCYGTGTDKIKDKLYGVALFIASENTILYFASTVNCPGIKENRPQVCGAQFDLNAQNVTSHYVNATGGYSEYCGGIEYRSAQVGFFRYQTISQMECMFAIAYTDIAEAKLDLSHSNVFDITLVRSQEQVDLKSKLYAGLIHIRRTENHVDYTFIIKNFCFINNKNIGGTNKIVSRGTIDNSNYQPIQIKLLDCYYDCGDENVAMTDGLDAEKLSTVNCNVGDIKTNEVIQLSLGDCQGKATPGPMVDITSTIEFSESSYFTFSDKFSKSSVFSNSYNFEPSEKFTKSNDFSNSDAFTKSSVSDELPIPSSESSEIIPILPGGGDARSSKKTSPGMIAGIAVAAAAVVAALIVGIIF